MAIFSINVRPRIKLGIANRSREAFSTGEVKEYTEVRITGLKSDASGGSVPATDYSWFKGVYASLVDGSAISFIKGLINQVKSLATRVGLLEDKYILKYVVPADTIAINLTTDKYGNAFNFVEGDEIIIDIKATFTSGSGLANRIWLRINNITNYELSSNKNLGGLVSQGAGINENSTYRIKIVGNRIIGISTSQCNPNTTTATGSIFPFKSNVDITAITRLYFSIGVEANSLIDAGTVILIKKK